MTPRRVCTLSFLLFVLSVSAACSLDRSAGTDASPSPARAAILPGRGGAGPTAEPVVYDPVVEVDLVHESGQIDRYYPGDLVTPEGTNTPAPTDAPAATETVIPTWTPTASYTPTATTTPTATSTPTATVTSKPTATPTTKSSKTPVPSTTPSGTPPPEATPTAEDARTPTNTPLPTATPTFTPTPGLGACVFIVTAIEGLNVRATPGGTRLGAVPYESRLAVDAYALSGGVQWYRIYWQPEVDGFVHSGFVVQQAGTDCTGLEDVTADVVEEPFYAGFHTLSASDTGAILAPKYVGKFNLIKCLDGGAFFCQAAKAANPNILTIYRSYKHDCPPPWVFSTPETWWDMIEGDIPLGFDAIEFQNECSPPIEYSELWADFNIEMVKIINRERGAAALTYSSGPGNPDLPFYPSMVKVVNFLKTSYAPNGIQNGIATHQSADAPAWIDLTTDNPYGSWINNEWVSDREIVFCRYMKQYGTSCDGLFFLVTESGVDDGYSGSKDVFSCEEKAAMYQYTILRKKEIGVVDGFAWWNAGAAGSWSSVVPCLDEMLLG
jgi:hypothetical protein